MTPRTVGPYEIGDELGKGGIGVVYAAVDRELGRPVAIKALRPELSRDQTFVDRFRAEATSLARLNHPNITTLYSLHREGSDLFMVMELVIGHTLEAVLARTQRLGVEETRAVIAQIASGLGYAHRMGVIHRDIKPSNLMVTDQGLVKIMDFGIARIAGSQRFTRQGEVIGTLAYLAPEQLKGSEGNELSDLYSLGIVCYELLAGQPPFGGSSEYELITAQVQRQPPPLIDRLPGLDPGVEAKLLQALAKDPQQRYPSVDAFSQAIGAAAVRGEAPEIVKDRIVGAAGGRPPQATRAIDLGTVMLAPSATVVRAEPGPAAAPPRHVPVIPAPAAAAAAARRSLKLPLLAGGGAALAAAAGLGFVLLRGPSLPAPGTPIGDPVPFLKRQLTLSAPARSIIARQAAFLIQHPDITITVTASCTPDETNPYGPGGLALMRANKVLDELTDRGGVAKDRVQTAATKACDAPSSRAVIVRN